MRKRVKRQERVKRENEAGMPGVTEKKRSKMKDGKAAGRGAFGGKEDLVTTGGCP